MLTIVSELKYRNIGSQDELLTALGDLPAVAEVQLGLAAGHRRHVPQPGRFVAGAGGASRVLGGGGGGGSGSAEVKHFIHLQYSSV